MLFNMVFFWFLQCSVEFYSLLAWCFGVIRGLNGNASAERRQRRFEVLPPAWRWRCGGRHAGCLQEGLERSLWKILGLHMAMGQRDTGFSKKNGLVKGKMVRNTEFSKKKLVKGKIDPSTCGFEGFPL